MTKLRVRLASRTRVLDEGLLVVGGAPLTVQRLRRRINETSAETALGRRWPTTGLGLLMLDDVPPVAVDDLTVVVPAHVAPSGWPGA